MSVDLHFLNVGHGDCTFIDFEGEFLTMIDVNNSRSIRESDVKGLAKGRGMTVAQFTAAPFLGKSTRDQYEERLVDPYDYYQRNFAGRAVFRYIQTHPEKDHMSGLHRIFWQEKVPLFNLWDTDNDRAQEEADFGGDEGAYVDWLVYQLLRNGKGPDDDHKVLRLRPGSTGQYYTDNGISILSPSPTLAARANRAESWNDISYILKVSYAGRSVILPGDAESPAWQDVIANSGTGGLSCDILKAAHHGRESGYDEDAALAMLPEIVICSVGKDPETDATDEYEALGATVFTTRDEGTITVKLWYDGEVWVYNEANKRIARLPPLP